MYPAETWIVPNEPDSSLIYKKINWSAEELTSAGLGGVMPPTPPALDSVAIEMMRWVGLPVKRVAASVSLYNKLRA